MKVSETKDRFLQFIDELPPDFLNNQSIVLTNGRWNIHLDYNGDNPDQGIIHLRMMAEHKQKLLKRFLASKSPKQILNVAQDMSEYFNYRQFTVSIGAKNNFFLGILLRIQVWADRVLS